MFERPNESENDQSNQEAGGEKFELTPEKEKELSDLAYVFIDKVRGDAEGFNGMDGADASIYLLNGYRENGMAGVEEAILNLLDRAKSNPAYKGTQFETGKHNEDLAKAIVREGIKG